MHGVMFIVVTLENVFKEKRYIWQKMIRFDRIVAIYREAEIKDMD